MRIITCYKIVPDEQDIIICADRTLSFDKSELKIGQYDLSAVEAGMQIVQAVGGKVSAISATTKQKESSKLTKAILSRGPEDLFLVIDESLNDADAYQTANVLMNAIMKMGNFDLVICGEGSSDLYAQQVGPQLGELLNLPVINAVSKITPNENTIIVERSLEDEVEILEIALPAVICVTSDINQPRIPGMKDILAAGKKLITRWGLKDIEVEDNAPAIKVLSTLAPQQIDRKNIILEGDSEEVIHEFFENLRKELC